MVKRPRPTIQGVTPCMTQPTDAYVTQPKYGQPVLPNLNVRQICPNCRSDPPNIIEEYSKGDLVGFQLMSPDCIVLTELQVCADCGTILGDRIVDTRSECK